MIARVIEQRRRNLGGFEVGRVLPDAARRLVGAFIFFDHMGPVDFPPGIPRTVDVRPHPHIGLSTITYLFEGEIMHRDSLGSEQAIRPGEVNWMVAGGGITHSERFERARREGGRMNGIQAWVALPVEHEETEPSFAHHGADELSQTESDGIVLRVVAGELFGARSPVKTHSPLFYAHAELRRGTRLELPDEHADRAAYVAAGAVEVDHRVHGPGRMLVFAPGSAARLEAVEPAVLMLLGGEPLGERFIEWNFVSSSRERIEQAKADWRAGRMKLPLGDDRERIPLPSESAPQPEPMS